MDEVESRSAGHGPAAPVASAGCGAKHPANPGNDLRHVKTQLAVMVFGMGFLLAGCGQGWRKVDAQNALAQNLSVVDRADNEADGNVEISVSNQSSAVRLLDLSVEVDESRYPLIATVDSFGFMSDVAVRITLAQGIHKIQLTSTNFLKESFVTTIEVKGTSRQYLKIDFNLESGQKFSDAAAWRVACDGDERMHF